MVLNPKGNENVGGYGGNKPAQIWHDAMEPILNQGPRREFPAADPAVAAGTKGSGVVERQRSDDNSNDRRPSGGAAGRSTPAPASTTPQAPAAPPVEPAPPADSNPVVPPDTNPVQPTN